MFIIRGVNVFPSQIEAALLAVEGTLPHYRIMLTRQKGLDEMEVQVEVTPELFSDKIGALEGLRQRLAYAMEHVLGLESASHSGRAAEHTAQRRESHARDRPAESGDEVRMKIHQLSLFP